MASWFNDDLLRRWGQPELVNTPDRLKEGGEGGAELVKNAPQEAQDQNPDKKKGPEK